MSYKSPNWYCEYLIQCCVPGNYIIVLFPQYGKEFGYDHNPYETKVFFATSSEIKQVRSRSAERYRDGGSTYIELESSIIWLPFEKEHLLIFYEEPLNIDEFQNEPIFYDTSPKEPITIVKHEDQINTINETLFLKDFFEILCMI